jgi:SAM-dependent methyltransferase
MPAFVAAPGGERPAPVFEPDIFEVESLTQAMAIIVTPEPDANTAERWEKETPFLVDDIDRFLAIGPDSLVLDYGCGIGRIAKPLIERFGCRVMGVDSSRSMRALAADYVRSDRFVVHSPEELDELIGQGFQADFCVSLWVIQHVFDPRGVIERIGRALRPGGLFYAMNERQRVVPTDQGWCDDHFDVQGALRGAFLEEEIHSLPAAVTTPRLAATTRIQVLRKRTHSEKPS